MNNLFLGADAQARFLFQSLKAHKESGTIKGLETQIVDGVRFSNDPEAGITGEYASDEGNLISARMHPGKVDHPRWQALHVSLGPAPLADAMLLGVAIKSRAPQSITTRLCIRSGRDGEFIDTFLPKTMISFAEPSLHLDVLPLDQVPDLPRSAQWRDLILFFRPGDVDIDLLDARLFIL
ncbi:hypothetical protein [Paenirhodobacter enshiensis]|uniref:Uncharacterized protein n=1 Tax=Paenirhodobacter enshiensis TaxID=1105367 RepID=A0A086XQE0_9RHOB|nr:hypothetical protein [Paenirhodobacter enshiensis]KFI24240.1 hypothetical protein CG50_13340 [Paenirhodobacter enshiensis]